MVSRIVVAAVAWGCACGGRPVDPLATTKPLAPPDSEPRRLPAAATFRPAVRDVEVLVDGDTLVLALRHYTGLRSMAPVPSTIDDVRRFGRQVSTDQWVLADGAEPCLAYPSQVVLDVSEPSACSAVDCDLDYARITLAGCGPGAVAIGGPAGHGAPPRPTWRYLAATTRGGSDLVREDPTTPAYERKLERYWRTHADPVTEPGFARRAPTRTVVPAEYRHLVAGAACGKRCLVSWAIDRLPTNPPIEAVTIEHGDPGRASIRASGSLALCDLETETRVHLFSVLPSGPVPLTAATQPNLAALGVRFRGALVDEAGVVRMALPHTDESAPDCELIGH